MLVDIGEHRVFYVETDHILSIEDHGSRHGCAIAMTGGKRVESDQYSREIVRKIEAAKKAAGV